MNAVDKQATPPAAVKRSPELVMKKAIALRNRLADIDVEPRDMRLILDTWTHKNFMDAAYGSRLLSSGDKGWVWAGLLVSPIVYERPISPISLNARLDPGARVSLDDDPFLLSIRFTKESNGRIVYLDDPDIDPLWT